jgi:hypothetical protein
LKQSELTGPKDVDKKPVADDQRSSSNLFTRFTISEGMEFTTTTSEVPTTDGIGLNTLHDDNRNLEANLSLDSDDFKPIKDSGLMSPVKIGEGSRNACGIESDEDSVGTSSRDSDESSNENSEDDSDETSNENSEDDSGESLEENSEDESALDDEYLEQFESMLVQPSSTKSNPSNLLSSNQQQGSEFVNTSLQVKHPPSSASPVQAKPIEPEIFSGIGTNVGCFDKNGKPNEKAASRGKHSKIWDTVSQISFSDICAAAMLARVADEGIPPFPDLIRCKSALGSIATIHDYNSSCDDRLADESMTRFNIIKNSNHFTDDSEAQKMRGRGSILVDWRSDDGDLLVDWGEKYSDSESDELEIKPIVSTWKPNGEYVVAISDEKKLDDCEVAAINGISFPKSRSICSDTDSESTFSEIKRTDMKYAGMHHWMGNKPLDTKIFEFHDESGPLLHKMQRKGQFRKKTYDPLHQHMSFRNAFQNRITSDIPEESEEKVLKGKIPGGGTMEKINSSEKKESEQALTVIFPRIDFHSGNKKTRRSKKGENCSLSTRRRRKIRVNEIKSAMVEEKGYIEGLFMLSKTTGKTVGCEIKSKI